MNCSEAEQFFDAYLDRELSGSLRLEFDAHRLRCPVCQQKLAMMEACEHILSRDSLAPTPPEDFTARVMDEVGGRRLIARRTRRRRIAIGVVVASQAAAVLAIALVWVAYWRPTASPALDEEFAAKVEDLIEAKDWVGLYDSIVSRAEERARAAGLVLKRVEEDLGGLARYAGNLSILSEFSDSADAAMPGPWDVFRPVPPAPAEEAEPASDGTGLYRL